MSLDSIEAELLSTLRSVETEMRNIKHVQQEQANAIIDLTKRMQSSINSLSVWVSDVQHEQREQGKSAVTAIATAASTTTSTVLRPLWALVAVAAIAVVLMFMLGLGLLWQNQQRIEGEQQQMTRIVDSLTPEQRAEWEGLLAELPAADQKLVRLLEIFMVHTLNNASLFNAEIRYIVARQALDLVDHERRLRALDSKLPASLFDPPPPGPKGRTEPL